MPPTDPAPPPRTPGSTVSRALDWWFRDRTTGGVTVVQAPNVTLLVFAFAWLARRVFAPTGTADVVLAVVATASLAVWGADEVARGVNPWRRLLGAVVLVALLAGIFRGGT